MTSPLDRSIERKKIGMKTTAGRLQMANKQEEEMHPTCFTHSTSEFSPLLFEEILLLTVESLAEISFD